MSRPLTPRDEKVGRTYGYAWVKQRKKYARSVGNRCEKCGAGGVVRLEVHHVDPLGSDAYENLELHCSACHRETEAERCININVLKQSEEEAVDLLRTKYRSCRDLIQRRGREG
jgi:hypothetical protein